MPLLVSHHIEGEKRINCLHSILKASNRWNPARTPFSFVYLKTHEAKLSQKQSSPQSWFCISHWIYLINSFLKKQQASHIWTMLFVSCCHLGGSTVDVEACLMFSQLSLLFSNSLNIFCAQKLFSSCLILLPALVYMFTPWSSCLLRSLSWPIGLGLLPLSWLWFIFMTVQGHGGPQGLGDG